MSIFESLSIPFSVRCVFNQVLFTSCRFILPTIKRSQLISFSGDLPDKPVLRLRLDAASSSTGIPERPESTGTSDYCVAIEAQLVWLK